MTIAIPSMFFLSQMLCRDSTSFPSIHRSFGNIAGFCISDR